jgi:sulfatase modifying factor 1
MDPNLVPCPVRLEDRAGPPTSCRPSEKSSTRCAGPFSVEQPDRLRLSSSAERGPSRRALVLWLVVSLGCACGPSEALDAGAAVDAAAVDAAAVDAGVDGGPGDAALSDAAPSDAGGVDGGEDDAGQPADGGEAVDASAPDAGPSACDVVGEPFACTDVTACAGTPLYGRCGAELRSVCCLDDPPCSVDGAPGLCLDVGQCPGTATPGRCPGAANIQCCTRPEEACDPSAAPAPNAGLVEAALDARCPDGMVFAGTFCVDAFEAALVQADGRPWSPFVNPGATPVRAVSLAYAVPQGYISGTQAGAACVAAGKRLCTDAEWLAACQGPAGQTYPYGASREDGRCNDARAQHPAIEYFGTADPSVFQMLGNACLNQLPGGLALTAQYGRCESPVGAFDMMGNLHEWTADPAGTFRGGFYVDTRINGSGCLYRTTAHDVSYWDYSTGFRCCADPR